LYEEEERIDHAVLIPPHTFTGYGDAESMRSKAWPCFLQTQLLKILDGTKKGEQKLIT